MKLTDLFRMRPLSVENFDLKDLREGREITNNVLRVLWIIIGALLLAVIICFASLNSAYSENTLLKNKMHLDVIQDSLLKQQQELLKDSI